MLERIRIFIVLLRFVEPLHISLVSSQAAEPHLLETYTPEVVRAYVSSRLESVSVVLREGLDDPLDDVTVIQQQLDQVTLHGVMKCSFYLRLLSMEVLPVLQTCRNYRLMNLISMCTAVA